MKTHAQLFILYLSLYIYFIENSITFNKLFIHSVTVYYCVLILLTIEKKYFFNLILNNTIVALLTLQTIILSLL